MKDPHDFQAARRSRRLHGWLQGILAFTLFLAVNHLLRQHPWSYDLSADGRHTLADETVSVARTLPAPVTILSTLSPEDESLEISRAAEEVRELGRRIEAVSEGAANPVTFRQIDPFRQRREAEQSGAQEPNVVIVQSGSAVRRIYADELYATKDLRRTAFRGEQALLGALLSVTADTRPVVYFLEGHGESRLSDIDPNRGLSQVSELLRQRNFELRPLDLASTGRVPDDAALVAVIGPSSAVLKPAQEALRAYATQRSGRLLVMLRPGVPHGLEDLLWDWGLLSDDALVVDNSGAFTSQTGDLVVRRLGEHPITQALADNNLPVLFGVARPVREDPGRSEDPGLTLHTLLQTSDSAWGERTYRNASRVTKDAVDVPGPVALAMVSERGAASRAGIALSGGRVVVFGTGDFITNGKLAQLGNWRMFLNTMNWMLARDEALAIPPRPIQRLQIALTREQHRSLWIWVQGVIPAAIGLVGLLVHLVRRK